jgi:hypothetical protein
VLALTARGLVARKVGDLAAARALYQRRSRVVQEAVMSATRLPGACRDWPGWQFWEGNEDEAGGLFSESLTTLEELGDATSGWEPLRARPARLSTW